MGEKTWMSWTASSLSATTNEAVVVLFDALTVENVPNMQKNTAPISGLRYNVVVEFAGPIAEIEAWAKRLDTGKVLSQIDGK